MREVLRAALVMAVVGCVWTGIPSAAQETTERLITLRVQPPSPSRALTITVSEGYAVEAQWSEGRATYRFALRPLVDDEDGSVHVAVESPATGRVLDEVVLTAGAARVETRTLPAFRIAVVRVRESQPARFGRQLARP